MSDTANMDMEEETPPDNTPTPDELVDKKSHPPPFEGDDPFQDDDTDHPSDVSHHDDLFAGKIHVISNVVFVIASAIYVAQEVTILPYYQFYKGVPYHIRETEDDDVWWQYYNDTDAFPHYLDNETDDYAWMEWYNNSFLDEEEELNEFIFQVPNADSKYENPDEEYAAWVSQYMILYFCAALGFLVTGVLELSVARRFWSKTLYGVMILAALFGILSSFFVNKDPYVSEVLNAVSVHLFAFEAVAIIISRFRSLKRMEMEAMAREREQSKESEKPQSSDWSELSTYYLGLPLMAWLGLGDISFFIGTSGDVVLSYFYIFENDYFEQAIAAIVTSVFWLLAALLYLGAASIELRRVKLRFYAADQKEKEEDSRKMQLILLSLTLLAIAVLVLGLVFGLDTSDEYNTLTDVSTDVSTDTSTGEMTDGNAGTPSPIGECNMTMSTFSQSAMMLTLAVTSSISTIEVHYAASVFAKTYEAMIDNELGESQSSYCDPYCREISDVVVVETATANIFESSERQATECDTELKLTFRVEGTFWACEGMPFPGIFSDPTQSSDADALNVIGTAMENGACQICPEDAASTGLGAPTSDEVLEAMEPYMTVLPGICELRSAEVLDDRKRS